MTGKKNRKADQSREKPVKQNSRKLSRKIKRTATSTNSRAARSVSREKESNPLLKKQVAYGSLLVVGVLLVAIALRTIIGGLQEDADARDEYEQLRTHFPAVSSQAPPSENSTESDSDPDHYYEDEDAQTEEHLDLRALSLDELASLNRDFIGWMNVGNKISYPVVRGNNNTKYIDTTFIGSQNTAGAIFMDYRNSRDFDQHVSIIYGHNTRDGTMFSALANYLDNTYLQQNQNITITTRDGRTLNYRIFAARLTDAWDSAYTVGLFDSERAKEEFPNAPSNADRFMLLSTCTRRGNDDERILVYAALT